jgi:L-cysteine/cystine lyase
VNLDTVRAGLPVVRRVAYLNAGTFGPLPRRTVEAMSAACAAELEDGRSGMAYWEALRSLRSGAREQLGRMIGAAPEAVALTRSTTDGCNIAVSSLRLRPEDEVVTTDAEHFGLLGALASSGARIRVARVNDHPAAEAVERIEAELTPRTRLVALSHVLWTTGHVLEVARLAGRGFAVLVDGAQSCGAIPLDVPSLGVDFYTVSGQKWLLGPDGTGALFVNPERLGDLAVALPSYYCQQSYEEDGTFVPADGAARFDNGTVPAPALAGLLESISFANVAGPSRFDHARRMAARCLDELALRVDVMTEPGHAGLVAFVPRGDAPETVARLAERGVVVRDLPKLGWIRASIGFWTSDDDVDRLVESV